jgi:hypothetical protein
MHDYSDDEEDDMHAGQIMGFDNYGVPILAGEYDSEDDSDYDSEEGGSGGFASPFWVALLGWVRPQPWALEWRPSIVSRSI